MKVNYQLLLDKEIEKTADTHPSLLLHACCAPCSSYVLEYLNKHFDITVFFYNPNISPRSEFTYRLNEIKRLISEMPHEREIKFIEAEYDSERFFEMSKGLEQLNEGGERCFKCYEMRLRRCAEEAKSKHFDYFTTTLSISPHKNAQKLNEIGKLLSEQYNVNYLYSDFKKRNGYKRSCELSAEYGLYRQNYCGCVFSKAESERRNKNNQEENMNNYNHINGGVCAAKGFKANGLNCGLNPDPNKNDLCLIVSDAICGAAAVYTQNKVKGAPITVTKRHLEQTGGQTMAVIANSKNANTCNADGIAKAEMMCELAARELGIEADKVIVASTGVIGQILPIEPIEKHIKALAEGLSYNGNHKAATAIMTTDTVPKETAVSFDICGKMCVIGAMAKGSGMIHPNMATTLNFITTDAAISQNALQMALSEIVKVTYNCLSIDGDTSTNDMVCVLANGKAENPVINVGDESYKVFRDALYEVMAELTKMLAKDGEGASKLIECEVSEAPDIDTAITVAKSVIRSPLFKCAMFGEDANWGRILCAIGYAEAEFDINRVDVSIASEAGEIIVCKNGAGVEFSEETAAAILHEGEIFIRVSLNAGDKSAKAWGCDLTYDYVKINGDYRS